MALGDHLRADEHVELAARRTRRAARRSRRGGGWCRGRRARRARPGRARATSASTRSVPKPTLLEIRAGALARTPSAAAPSSCSSGSARAAAALCTVSVTLQFGHSIVAPHWRQKTTVAKPRRFSRTIACSPRSSRSVIASRSGELRIDVGPVRRDTPRACRRSCTSASGRSSTRLLERDQLVAPALRVVVALERRRRRAEHDQRAARAARASTATSRPW